MVREIRKKEAPLEAEESVRVNHLHYIYPDGTKALDGVDLTIKKGEKVAIMGANGSGKSTFFLTLNGIIKPKIGEIYINGKRLEYSKKELVAVRKQVGIVFQDPDNQLFSASVTQEISFGVLNLGVSKDEARKRVEEIMDKLGISDLKDKPTHFLSGGEKKLVAIADILVMEPDIIILDEPTSALDPKHAALIDQIIEDLGNEGITVIIATHSGERALAWADKVVLFHKGRVLKTGTPLDVFNDSDHLKTTNLKKPELLKMYELLEEKGLLLEDSKPPRTLEELKATMK